MKREQPKLLEDEDRPAWDGNILKSRKWVFTINNWTDEDWKGVIELGKEIEEDGGYLIVGKEVGEEGTPHLQGYVRFKNPRSRKELVKRFLKRAWIACAKGSETENYHYCAKQGCEEEWGIYKEDEKGRRNDLELARRMVVENYSLYAIGMTVGAQATKHAELLKRVEPSRGLRKVEVIWLWGPPGTGKTRTAWEYCKRLNEFEDPWMSSRSLKWWDGYEGQREIIIDDFRADFCTYHELLRILDIYPFRVEVKGGSRLLMAELIIITSCFPPDKVYNTREDIGQLLRRISACEFVDEPVTGTGTEVGGNNKAPTSVPIRLD
jgi:hypothetical protein